MKAIQWLKNHPITLMGIAVGLTPAICLIIQNGLMGLLGLMFTVVAYPMYYVDEFLHAMEQAQ